LNPKLEKYTTILLVAAVVAAVKVAQVMAATVAAAAVVTVNTTKLVHGGVYLKRQLKTTGSALLSMMLQHVKQLQQLQQRLRRPA
jgi:1-deoxy-D-xylulose 5-phosphate reductoisomerase